MNSKELEQVDCDEETYCQRCGASLTHAVWMELDQRTDTYTATENEVPSEHSQGWFPFGIACAGVERRLHEKAQEVAA